MRILILVGIAVILGTGCGGISVDRLSLVDPRLPVDARRWVADAEDAVVVARARRNAAQSELNDARKWQSSVMAGAQFSGGEGAGLQMKRDQMAITRLQALQSGVDVANAELDLSQWRRQLIYAETAMRHDIAVYNMPPLQAAVDKSLSTVVALRERHRKDRQKALASADAWWRAWQKFTAGKNDTRPFWTTAP